MTFAPRPLVGDRRQQTGQQHAAGPPEDVPGDDGGREDLERQRSEQRDAQEQGQHERRRAVGPDAAVAHDLDPTLGREAAPQAVRAVGEAVLVEGAGDQHHDAHGEHGRRRATERGGEGPPRRDAGQRHDQTDRGEEGAGPAQVGIGHRGQPDRDPREQLQGHRGSVQPLSHPHPGEV
jgi:hypothetical protein